MRGEVGLKKKCIVLRVMFQHLPFTILKMYTFKLNTIKMKCKKINKIITHTSRDNFCFYFSHAVRK